MKRETRAVISLKSDPREKFECEEKERTVVERQIGAEVRLLESHRIGRGPEGNFFGWSNEHLIFVEPNWLFIAV